MGLLAYAQRWAGGFADGNAAKSVDAQFLNAVETALLGLLGAAPTDGQAYVYDNALGRFKTVLLTNAHIDPAAAIAKSKLAALNIADADVAAGAAIAASKLAGNFPISKLNGYPADSEKILIGDGTWENKILFGIKSAPVSTAGTTFAAGADVLASPISFNANGTSSYVAKLFCRDWINSGANRNELRLNLDGADAGIMADAQGGAQTPVVAAGVFTPSAGAHTVNVRLLVNAGTGTLEGGAGGAGAALPILVTLERL